MNKFFYHFAAMGLVLVAGVSTAFAAGEIGAVERARGQTSATQLSLQRPLAQGSAVKYLDQLHTGNQSRLKVKFLDGTQLALGQGSDLNIDEMVYDPGKRGSAAFRLVQGVFRMVSGQINKVPGGQLTITTPVATIGVRGTDFWGEQTPDMLKMALLNDGELSITTPQGTVVLREPLSAVVIRKGQAPGDVVRLTTTQLDNALATIDW